MANSHEIARSYARAAFELARERGEITVWTDILAAFAYAIKDPEIKQFLLNPVISWAEKEKILIDLMPIKSDGLVDNLILLLVENDRLMLLPEISEFYEQMKVEHESVLNVKVISKISLTSLQEQVLQAVLQRKYAKKIILQFEIDGAILGGLMLRIGDLVIDGSLRHKLEKLRSNLLV